MIFLILAFSVSLLAELVEQTGDLVVFVSKINSENKTRHFQKWKIIKIYGNCFRLVTIIDKCKYIFYNWLIKIDKMMAFMAFTS